MTINPTCFNRKTRIALSLIGLIAAFLALNLKTLNWSFAIIDSPILLSQAILYSPLEYFTSPSKYQYMSFNNLTPWSSLSWDIDYNLFQLESFGFRFHQLVSLAAMMSVVYLILYRMTRAILNTSIFCLAIMTVPATFSVGDDLTCRHYLEGMVFCLLSFYCAQLFNAKQQLAWLAFSVFFYVLSITAKEVYIPLPGILFCLYSGNFRRRVLLVSPYAAVLMAYIAWRFYMLGGIGGYSVGQAAPLTPDQHPLSLSEIALRLGSSLFENPAGSLAVLAIFAFVLAVNFQKLDLSKRFGLLIGASGLALPILALLPTMALGIIDSRWLFATSVAGLLFFSYLCSTTESKTLTALVYVVILACSLEAFYVRVTNSKPSYSAGNKIPQYILQSDSSHYLRIPQNSELVALAYNAWVYLAKLHNGEWGTLTISDIGQLRYHDTKNRTALPLATFRKNPEEANTTISADLDLVKSVRYDSKTDALIFNFAGDLDSNRCFVYIFGPGNGALFHSTDSEQWSVSYRNLNYILRVSGYKLPETSVAFWCENSGNRFYSKPIKLRELIDLDSL